MKPSLVKLFNESAQKAYDAFPERLKDLVVLTPALDTQIYASPEIVQRLTDNVDSIKTAIERMKKDFKHLVGAIGFAMPYATIAGKNARLIAMLPDPPGVYTERFTDEMRGLYVLEHEIGHHVVPWGGTSHLRECQADAYGAIRHVQTYGTDNDFFDYINKAYSVVLGNSYAHYTQDTLQAVNKLSQETDLSALTLPQAAELAAKIANENQVPGWAMEKVITAFQPAVAEYRKQIGGKIEVTDKLYAQDKDAYALFVNETMKVLDTNPDDYYVVKAGREFFNYPPVRAFIVNEGLQAALDILAAPLPQRPEGPLPKLRPPTVEIPPADTALALRIENARKPESPRAFR